MSPGAGATAPPDRRSLREKKPFFRKRKANTMAMNNLTDLMLTGMSYVLDFEEKIAKAATEVATKVSSPQLKELFEKTGTKSKDYAQTIEQSFGHLGQKVERNDNPIAKAMVGEMMNMIEHTSAGPVRDAALITAANQQQQYRVASYGSLATYAKVLGKEGAVKELAAALEDSKNGDRKFTELADGGINHEAAKAP